MTTAAEIVARVAPKARSEYREGFKRYSALLDAAGINTPLRLAHFMAQVLEESANLTRLRENMNYSASRIVEVFGVGHHSAGVTKAEAKKLARNPEALAERVYGLGNPLKAKELGNVRVGDGWTFRGNGPLGTTGRANHQRVSEECGVDFVAHPEWMTLPEHILKPAIAFWTRHDLNTYADRNDIRAITRIINGGYNGYDRRVKLFEKVYALCGGNVSWMEAKASEETYNLQRDLADLGYKLKVDGRYGPETVKVVKAFQKQAGIGVDGIAGPVTLEAMKTRLRAGVSPSQDAPVISDATARTTGVASTSLGTLGSTIKDAAMNGRDLSDGIPVLGIIFSVLIVVGIGLMLWPQIKPFIHPRVGAPS